MRRSCLVRDTYTGKVEYYQGKVSVFKVAGNQALEALLTSSVPELKTNDFTTCGDVLADKIDPYCRLIY